jgi:hypothetical protein
MKAQIACETGVARAFTIILRAAALPILTAPKQKPATGGFFANER